MEQQQSHSPPDYVLAALNKRTNVRVFRIGVGYSQPDGSIKILLQPFVQLPNDGEWSLRLFVYDKHLKQAGDAGDNVVPFADRPGDRA